MTDEDINGVGISSEEQAQINEIAELTGGLLEKRYTAVNKKKLRGVHPKSHGCVNATFTIETNIAPNYQEGLFSSPGKKHTALIRFSNATALVKDDITNGSHSSRGMAIKVLIADDSGPVLVKVDGERNQDFLMINSPSFAFSNVPDYLRLTQVISEDNDNAARFFTPLANPVGFTDKQIVSAKKSFDLIQKIGNTPVGDPLQIKYFGAAPFKFGDDKIMRFAVVPTSGALVQQAPDNPTPNYLREVLNQRMKQARPISFDFMVQVRGKNERNLMLEDASSHWDENEFPFVKIATVNIVTPQANIDCPENEAMCENLKFSPWHSLVAHEPLGGINRLRKAVYKASSTSRSPPQCPSQAPRK